MYFTAFLCATFYTLKVFRPASLFTTHFFSDFSPRNVGIVLQHSSDLVRFDLVTYVLFLPGPSFRVISKASFNFFRTLDTFSSEAIFLYVHTGWFLKVFTIFFGTSILLALLNQIKTYSKCENSLHSFQSLFKKLFNLNEL